MGDEQRHLRTPGAQAQPGDAFSITGEWANDRAMWSDVAMAVAKYSHDTNDGYPEPRIVVVPTRYCGVYEGGPFAALDVDDLESEAFGQDLPASSWWDMNKHRVGIGDSPDKALLDWHAKHPGSHWK